jgi:hypothetical protein
MEASYENMSSARLGLLYVYIIKRDLEIPSFIFWKKSGQLLKWSCYDGSRSPKMLSLWLPWNSYGRNVFCHLQSSLPLVNSDPTPDTRQSSTFVQIHTQKTFRYFWVWHIPQLINGRHNGTDKGCFQHGNLFWYFSARFFFSARFLFEASFLRETAASYRCVVSSSTPIRCLGGWSVACIPFASYSHYVVDSQLSFPLHPGNLAVLLPNSFSPCSLLVLVYTIFSTFLYMMCLKEDIEYVGCQQC